MNIEKWTAVSAISGMVLAAALSVAGVASAQAPAARACSLKDGGRGCTERDPQIIALQAKADQAIARINANPQAQTAFHGALARGDKAGAARILQENGLSEAGQFPLTYRADPDRSHDRMAAGHGTTATPACGYQYHLRMVIWLWGIDWEVVETWECNGRH